MPTNTLAHTRILIAHIFMGRAQHEVWGRYKCTTVPPRGHLANGHSITILAQTFAAVLVRGSSLAQAWLWIALLALVDGHRHGSCRVGSGLHGGRVVGGVGTGGRGYIITQGSCPDSMALRLSGQPALRAGQIHGQDRGATTRAFLFGAVRVVGVGTEQHGGGSAVLHGLARPQRAGVARARRARRARRRR